MPVEVGKEGCMPGWYIHMDVARKALGSLWREVARGGKTDTGTDTRTDTKFSGERKAKACRRGELGRGN